MSIDSLPAELLTILISKVQEYTKVAYKDQLDAAKAECELYRNIFRVFKTIQLAEPYATLCEIQIYFCCSDDGGGSTGCNKYHISIGGTTHCKSESLLVCSECCICRCPDHNLGLISHAPEDGADIHYCLGCLNNM